MSWIRSEMRLIARSRLSVLTLIFLAGLSGLSVWFGLQETQKQQQTITRLLPLHEQDVALLARPYQENPKGGDAGDAAYYTFYYTWDAPSTAAFAALGLRDVAPYVLRVRALGLQAQLYDGEVFNPELALPGRFDFSFVLIYLSPLFIIALLHDLVSSERQSGRLRLLRSLAHFSTLRWLQRVVLRYLLVFIALTLPLVIGAVIASTALSTLLAFIVITLAYLAFWCGVCVFVATRHWHSVTHATALVGIWVVLTLILPTLVNLMLTRFIPVAQGVDLMLTQRQNVHSAWEIPREVTMQRFFKHHPEWQGTDPLPPDFHWKWYFAFHQVGDESVSDLFHAYRTGLSARQQWTDRLGWILPSVAAQSALHRLANTDLQAQLHYQDQIIAFHQQIRNFYYPYLFNDRPFMGADFAKRPVYQPLAETPQWLSVQSLPFLLITIFMLVIGLRTLKNQHER